jgi:hypothetical protein
MSGFTINDTAANLTSPIYQSLNWHPNKMPSAISFASTAVTKPSQQSIYRKRMSVTQTYMIAHQARGKLAKEANCPDHNLHRLVCHANMLDTLIFDLAHAEEEQESYLNKLSSGAREKRARKPKVEKWAQVVMDKLEEESESEDEYEDDDSSDEEYEHCENKDSNRANVIASVVFSSEEEDGANELQEEHARLALVRTKTLHQFPKASE